VENEGKLFHSKCLFEMEEMSPLCVCNGLVGRGFAHIHYAPIHRKFDHPRLVCVSRFVSAPDETTRPREGVWVWGA
jgi:hypothetical protein